VSISDAIAAASREPSLDAAGLALVGGIANALDIESACLYVLEDAEGAPCLRLVANKGEHSAFMADTPTISLDADLPIVRVLLERAAGYDADPHGLGDLADSASGVGRWRAAIGAQAEATLPLLVRGEAIGALALSWRTPREFSDADRRELELLADASAQLVERLRSVAPEEQLERRNKVAVAVFAVDRAGRVAEGVAPPGAVLRIAAAAANVSDDDRGTFCEVAACRGGRTAVALGVVRTADGGASARAVEAERLLGGWMGHGLEPAAALAALAAWAARDGNGVDEVGALACILDTGRRCVTYATTGHALAAILAADARFFFDATGGHAPPAGKASERAAVLLPGDRLALWSGDLPALAAGDGPAFVHTVLADASSQGRTSAADLIRECNVGGCAEVAVVVDVGGA
jgi:hypothetical protein